MTEAMRNALQQAIPTHVRQLYLELSMVSNGSTMNFNPGGGSSERVRPPGDRFPLHERFLEDWRARGEPAVSTWRAVLDKTRRQSAGDRPEGESEAQRAERAIDEGEGLRLSEAALRFSFSESRIRKMRMAANLDPTDGTEFPANREPKAHALELHAKGWSTREIQKVTGVHKTQVLRWVEKERAA